MTKTKDRGLARRERERESVSVTSNKIACSPLESWAHPREIKCSISLQPGTDCKMRVRRTEEKEKEEKDGWEAGKCNIET